MRRFQMTVEKDKIVILAFQRLYGQGNKQGGNGNRENVRVTQRRAENDYFIGSFTCTNLVLCRKGNRKKIRVMTEHFGELCKRKCLKLNTGKSKVISLEEEEVV